MSLRKRLVFGGCLLFAVSAVVFGDSFDPGITIKAGDPPPPLPISTGINDVQADGVTSPLTFDFFNDLGLTIDGFTFETTVVPDFTGPLSCTTLLFASCMADYTPSSGLLEYVFAGLNPASGAVGIAPGAPFTITLVGWTDATGLYDADHPPQPFMNTVETVTPEPTTAAGVLTGLLLLVGIVELRRRQQALASQPR